MTVRPLTHPLTCGVRPKVTRAYHELPVSGYGAGMSAQPAESSVPASNRPAKNLDAISHVLDSDEVDTDVRQRFQVAFAKAWATARDGLTVQPLLDLVEIWHPDAVLWSDPESVGVLRNGIPPESRGNALRAVAELRAKHGPSPAFDKLESLAARW